MSDLIAITYDDDKTAFAALDKLGELQKMQLITLADAAVAVKDQKGKVKVIIDQIFHGFFTAVACLHLIALVA